MQTISENKPRKKKVSLKTETKSILPTGVIQDVNELNLSQIMTDKAMDLASRIIYKGARKKKIHSEFIPLSSNFLQKIYGKHYYNDFFNQMKERRIIISNHSFERPRGKIKGKCLSYKINPQLLEGEFAAITYKQKVFEMEKDQENISINRTFFSKTLSSPHPTPHHTSPPPSPYPHPPLYPPLYSLSFPVGLIKADLGLLKYDVDKINLLAQEHINRMTPDSFVTGEQIGRSYFEVRNNITGRNYYTTKANAVQWATLNECTLIEDKNSYYLDYLKTYVAKRKADWQLNFKYNMGKLNENIFYVKRNERNKRLDHNLTSLWNGAMEQVKKDNDLVEIDLSNSQFAIHALWLRSEKLHETHADVLNYVNLCETGDLYEELVKLLGMDRSKEKKEMMVLAFSRTRSSSATKKLFRRHFPNVVEHIDGFKK